MTECLTHSVFPNLYSQYAGTFVLKRRNEPHLSKRSFPEGSYRKLRQKHKIYETIERPSTQPLPNIDVILTQYVEGEYLESSLTQLTCVRTAK